MESCCPQACHHENSREHSGQIFDWWRCSKDGQILKPVPQDRIVPPLPAPPLRRDHLCWPLYKGAEQPKDVKPKSEDDDCEVSRDFWPDSWDKTGKRPRLEHARPPFLPALLPNQFGVVKYPPPYTHYCRTRETPLSYVSKT
ncbi:unnamed protein product [Lymnaea stagnalis]|uniref:Uncharacterized protein n=1 Tax=Lymnaea stagnalis TaxID=6523 RepID=A0AAV2GYF0_LYMST